jgi:hypothetical protein
MHKNVQKETLWNNKMASHNNWITVKVLFGKPNVGSTSLRAIGGYQPKTHSVLTELLFDLFRRR